MIEIVNLEFIFLISSSVVKFTSISIFIKNIINVRTRTEEKDKKTFL